MSERWTRCSIGFLLGLVLSARLHAAPGPVLFYTVLSAEEESATTASAGSGRADFSLDRDTLRLSWRVTFGSLTSPLTGAHVHGPQRPGTNAGVQIDLAGKARGSPLTGSSILTNAQLEYLLAGRMYVNLQTTRYPEGELRGQIQRLPPAKAATAASGPS